MSRTYHSKKTFKRKMLKIREARERNPVQTFFGAYAEPSSITSVAVSRESWIRRACSK